MNNFLYRIMDFMRGRRGTDQLGLFLLVTSFLVELVGRLFHNNLIYYVGVGLLVWAFFRMFSRNIYKREQENQKFLSIWNSFRGGNRYKTNTATYGNKQKNPKYGVQYCYYYCPSCKQQVRVPAGKGKVRITCPTCKDKFELHT